MNTVNFHYTPNARDYISAVWAQLRQRWGLLTWLVLSAFGMLCMLAYIPLAMLSAKAAVFPLSYYPTFLLALLPIALPWLIYFVLVPLSLHFQVNRNERLRAETFGQADDQGLILRNRFSETKVDWGTFARIIETKRHFVLPCSVNEQMSQAIPKRAFDSPQAELSFRQLLQAKVRSGEIKPFSTRGAVIVRLLPVIILILLVIAYAVSAFLRTSR